MLCWAITGDAQTGYRGQYGGDSVEPTNEALAADCDECSEETYTFSTLPTITKGAKYWIVHKGDQAGDIFAHEIASDNHTSDYVYTLDGGTTWTGASYDFYFQIDGCD
jgi:hypothetical protein